MVPLRMAGLTVWIHGQQLLSGVSLQVHQGERVGLLGASGSGKSLLARAVLDQLPAGSTVEGSIEVAGQEVLGQRRRSRNQPVAGIAQDSATSLNPLVRVGTQVALPLRRYGGLSATQAAVRAGELLRAVGLPGPDGLGHRFPGQLSGGQRQRACVALALACRSRLLIADEPTTALDVVSQRTVVEALRLFSLGNSAAEPPGLLFITHDLAVAAHLCTRAVVLVAGAVVEAGPLRDLLAAPQHPYTQSLVASARAGELPQSAPRATLAGATR